MTKHRNSTLDIAKGIGIILVVLGHNWMLIESNGELERIIFSFHVPLFFFLSGVFLSERESLIDFIKYKTESLLKPYFVVLLSIAFAKAMLNAIAHAKLDLSNYNLFFGVFYGVGRTISWIPMWFLVHLFLSSIAALIIVKLIRTNYLLYFYIAISLAVGVYILRPTDLPWSADLLLISSAFMLLGYNLRHSLMSNPVVNYNYFFVAILVFTSLHYYFDHSINLNERAYGDPLISTAQVFAGIYLCICISSILSKYATTKKMLSYVGSATLFILIFHPLFQNNVLMLLVDTSLDPLICGFFALITGLLGPLLILNMVKRNRFLSILLLQKKQFFKAEKVSHANQSNYKN